MQEDKQARRRMNFVKIKQRPLEFASRGKRAVRTQFAALCWRQRSNSIEILLVTSRRRRRWILPKGWPMHGQTPAQAAATEAWEEAGVTGKVTPVCLGIYSYTKERRYGGLPCVVAVFPVRVQHAATNWPERNERRRKWVSAKKAATMVDEPELRRLLREFDPRDAGL